jgi:hypothetical protein
MPAGIGFGIILDDITNAFFQPARFERPSRFFESASNQFFELTLSQFLELASTHMLPLESKT